MATHYETSDDIRIANGHISKSALLSDSSYKVANFPIQSDSKYPYWLAYVDGGVNNGVIEQSLAGDGGLYGKLSGTLTFALFSPDMQGYFFSTVMGNSYLSAVSIYFFHPRYKFIAVNCYLRWFENIAQSGNQQTDTDYTNVVMQWNRGVIVGNAYSSAYSEAYS